MWEICCFAVIIDVHRFLPDCTSITLTEEVKTPEGRQRDLIHKTGPVCGAAALTPQTVNPGVSS